MAAPPARVTNDALEDIQGFITSGYGHLPQAAYVFATITDAAGARRWLARVASSITSSRRWTDRRDPSGGKPRLAINVGLTAEGLRAIGLREDVVRSFPIEFQDGIASPDRSRILGDTGTSAPERWEIGGPRTQPVHAVLLLFAADERALDEVCREQRTLLLSSGGIEELPGATQRGYRPESGNEPFGFHDGVAQPAIAGIDGHGVPTGEFILGYENHYGLIPPSPVVPRDLDPARTLPELKNPYHLAGSLGDLGFNGSFLVYRKLRQDVAGFWQFMANEASRRGQPDPSRMVWLASKCVGRWPSGAPLVLTGDGDDARLSERDDFFYASDPDGLRCPLGAHIRRTNPRDGLKPYPQAQSLSMTEAHRLLRRGRMYGPPLFDPRVLLDPSSQDAHAALSALRDDGQERGLHFFCVNASLKSQFEFVQQTWCNNPHFGGLDDNLDPLSSGAGDMISRMTIPHEKGALRTHPLPRFVTVRAGAYLFLPSLTALRYLADMRPATSSSRS